MGRPPKDSPLFDGTPGLAVAKIGGGGRITIPQWCVKHLGWPSGSKLRLVADIYDRGCVRLYLHEYVAPKLEAIKLGLEERLSDFSATEALQSFRYRYRPLTLEQSTPSSRITLQQHILLELGLRIGDKTGDQYVLIEVGDHCIQVVSLDFAKARADAARDDINVKLD